MGRVLGAVVGLLSRLRWQPGVREGGEGFSRRGCVAWSKHSETKGGMWIGSYFVGV